MALEDPALPSSEDGPTQASTRPDRIVEVAGAVDVAGFHGPAWLEFQGERLVGVSALRPSVAGVEIQRRPGILAMPALVNAHAHLDLTAVGPVSMDLGFDGWLEQVRSSRPRVSAEVASAIRLGVEASRDGGVVAIGDIVGAAPETTLDALERSPLVGVAFIECLGIGRREAAGLESVGRIATLARDQRRRIAVGISPHAPYSCSPAVYAAAAATGLPITTHVGESIEELEFCRSGAGPLGELLRRVGAIQGHETPPIGGVHPVRSLPASGGRPWLLAHVNVAGIDDAEEQAVFDRLRELDATVVYCPRATRTLGHLGRAGTPHPWRRMRAAGIRVALGTDGVPCLDRADRISPLDDLAEILDTAADLPTLVEMATVNGAVGLGLPAEAFRFSSGCSAGVLGVEVGRGDVVEGLIRGARAVEWLSPPRFETLRAIEDPS